MLKYVTGKVVLQQDGAVLWRKIINLYLYSMKKTWSIAVVEQPVLQLDTCFRNLGITKTFWLLKIDICKFIFLKKQFKNLLDDARMPCIYVQFKFYGYFPFNNLLYVFNLLHANRLNDAAVLKSVTFFKVMYISCF